MPSRADVELLRRNQRRVVSLAVSTLNQFWSGLGTSDPVAVRDALLEFVPALTDRYGDIAATVAADWYEEMREAAGFAGGLTPEMSRTVRREVVQNSVRYAAGGLFEDTPEKTLRIVSGAVDRYVKSPARRTIRINAERDGARYARVPTGSETCAFCLMVAGRGFVYGGKETAGMFDKYHNECDCQVVPDWSKDPKVEGYNPDALYGQYLSARDAAGDHFDTQGILKNMRDMFDLK